MAWVAFPIARKPRASAISFSCVCLRSYIETVIPSWNIQDGLFVMPVEAKLPIDCRFRKPEGTSDPEGRHG